ncbi:hypothetical protein [Mollivirus kamchatka]|nr:hypothetical protein [Mollivirus kamchatka]
MPRRGKWYAVAVGKRPGVYASWDEAQEQVQGHRNARVRCFATERAARDFVDRRGASPVVPSFQKARVKAMLDAFKGIVYVAVAGTASAAVVSPLGVPALGYCVYFGDTCGVNEAGPVPSSSATTEDDAIGYALRRAIAIYRASMTQGDLPAHHKPCVFLVQSLDGACQDLLADLGTDKSAPSEIAVRAANAFDMAQDAYGRAMILARTASCVHQPFNAFL